MGALLVAWSAHRRSVSGWLRGTPTPSPHSALAVELARPIEGPADAPRPRRDIYLIVLDEYANSDVLRERFGLRQPPVRGQPPRAGLPRAAPGAEQLRPHAAVAALAAQHGAPGRPRARAGPEDQASGAAELPPGAQPGGPVPRGAGLPLRLLPFAVVALDQRQRRWPTSSSSAWTGFDFTRALTDGRAAADGPRARACCATSTGTTAGRRHTSGGRSTAWPTCPAPTGRCSPSPTS